MDTFFKHTIELSADMEVLLPTSNNPCILNLHPCPILLEPLNIIFPSISNNVLEYFYQIFLCFHSQSL